VLNHGGTDASPIQRLRAVATVATLSIPARYILPVNETVAITDADNSVALLASYLQDAHDRDYTVGKALLRGSRASSRLNCHPGPLCRAAASATT